MRTATGHPRSLSFLAPAALWLLLFPAALRAEVAVVGPEWLSSLPAERLASVTRGRPVLLFSPDDLSGRIVAAGGGDGTPVHQVVPLDNAISPYRFAAWRETLPDPARGGGDFLLDNGSIRGIGRYESLGAGPVTLPGRWPKRPLLVVDALFLNAMYRDEVRTPMVRSALKLYRTLSNAGVATDEVRIVNRNGDRNFPLEFGYVPLLLRELFSDPDAFSRTIPEKWARLDRAQTFSFFAQPREAATELEALLGVLETGAVPYQLAQIALSEGAVETGVRFLDDAGRTDPDYARGFLAQAAHFWGKGDRETAAAILRAGRVRFPKSDFMTTGLARVLTEMAWYARTESPDRSAKLKEEALALPLSSEARKEILKAWE